MLHCSSSSHFNHNRNVISVSPLSEGFSFLMLLFKSFVLILGLCLHDLCCVCVGCCCCCCCNGMKCELEAAKLTLYCVCSVPELEDGDEDEMFGGEFTVASLADKCCENPFFLQMLRK